MKVAGNLDLTNNELQRAKAHGYASLPAYVADDDAGRIIYVTAGANQGYWLGNGDGGGSWAKLSLGSNETSWAVTNQAINDGVTFQSTVTSSLSPAPEKGIILKIVVASSLPSGFVVVKLYNDTGRSEKIYETTFDLASALLTDRIPVGFELDNQNGDIYVDIVNNTGSAGTFDLTITGAGIIQVPTSAPPGSGSGINDGVAGDGVAYNAVQLRLDLDLDADPGLELNGASGVAKLRVKTDPSGGLARAAAGLQVDSTVVRTTGDQAITGVKEFSGFKLTPAMSAGPPGSGTHVVGEFHMDSNLDIWFCTGAGTPGTWTFWGFKEQVLGGATDGSSYTGTVSAGSTLDTELTLTGRRGVFRKIFLWGAAPSYSAANIDAPFRLEAYPNSDRLGLEMLWTVTAQVRTTYISGAETAPQTVLSVNSVGAVALDDLVRLRKLAATVAEEYGRVITRTPGGPSITVDEATNNDLAANDPVMMVTEVMELYWKNNDADPADYYKVFLRWYNDHPTQDLIFGYQFVAENLGGGIPV